MPEEGRGVHITSEVGRLTSALVHCPGAELERLTIENKDALLFDDILWVEEAQREHRVLTSILRENDVDLLYFQECLSEILKNLETRGHLLDEVFALEALDHPLVASLKDALSGLEAGELAHILVAGLTCSEATPYLPRRSLVLRMLSEKDFLIRPLPNLYIQRDPYAFVGNGALVSVMQFAARRRESLYARYIFEHHPRFASTPVIFGATPSGGTPYHFEGGDLLVLNNESVAIGISERTTAGAVQVVGQQLARMQGIRHVLAVDIPKRRSYMHLDTVCTMVDRDTFTIFPGVRESLSLYLITYSSDGEVESITEPEQLGTVLEQLLHREEIRFIETGAGNPVASAREQWNDGTNTLALSPGEVLTFRRNVVSNQHLREHGIKVLEARGSELVKGRGGPRCIVMPLSRDEL
ncbi:MAG: arginine deiminase [Synergistales bacterium]|nr:arginine deiminase [Synergistales bacterium]